MVRINRDEDDAAWLATGREDMIRFVAINSEAGAKARNAPFCDPALSISNGIKSLGRNPVLSDAIP
jgi:hypothetical protein